MVELAFDTFVQYSFPNIASSIVSACDSLGAEQEPPYSHGNYFIEIVMRFRQQSWMHKTFYNDMCEPIFALALRHGYLYSDPNFATFSTRRIEENWRTVPENIAIKYPGYLLNKSGHIYNNSDHFVNMDDLLALMRSRDIDRYESEKELFFGNVVLSIVIVKCLLNCY